MKTIASIATAIAIAVLAAPAAGAERPPTTPKTVTVKAKPKKVRARSAWLYDGAGGRPGQITDAPPVWADEYRKMISLPNGMGGYFLNYEWALRFSNTAGPTASRSPATSAAQDVNVHYHVQFGTGRDG